MENDSIRASGSETLVDIWIDGKIRSICVSQEAIGAYLDFEKASRMTEEDRCLFVRDNLTLVLSAAKSRLGETDLAADTIVIDAGHLQRPDGRVTDRRKVERRAAERRKGTRPLASRPDRRRADRRHGERRTRAPKKDS